jgi:anhydro-N-acetylmuramic acid kinase
MDISMAEYYIGLLSGTSMDAIDAAIIDFSPHPPKLVCTLAHAIPEQLKIELQSLCSPGMDEINRLGQADVTLGELFSTVVLKLLDKAKLSPKEIIAIGSHGQTVRHRPDLKTPFTLQIGDPNMIAAQTGIATIADFRRKDMALGGQGAPLAPAFHEFLFRNTKSDCFVINIGGIANLSYLPGQQSKSVIGFDTGPGNTLLDRWAKQHINKAFDENGNWARTGKIDSPLLDQLYRDPYFSKTFPKSTGPEYFNLEWLETFNTATSPEDTQRTLLALTARSIAHDINALSNNGSIYLAGGGTKNTLLVDSIRASLPNYTVKITDKVKLPADWLEAMLFAWLAKRHTDDETANIPSVTGAKKATRLGGLY